MTTSIGQIVLKGVGRNPERTSSPAVYSCVLVTLEQHINPAAGSFTEHFFFLIHARVRYAHTQIIIKRTIEGTCVTEERKGLKGTWEVITPRASIAAQVSEYSSQQGEALEVANVLTFDTAAIISAAELQLL